jgi:hypothetical protein
VISSDNIKSAKSNSALCKSHKQSSSPRPQHNSHTPPQRRQSIQSTVNNYTQDAVFSVQPLSSLSPAQFVLISFLHHWLRGGGGGFVWPVLLFLNCLVYFFSRPFFKRLQAGISFLALFLFLPPEIRKWYILHDPHVTVTAC